MIVDALSVVHVKFINIQVHLTCLAGVFKDVGLHIQQQMVEFGVQLIVKVIMFAHGDLNNEQSVNTGSWCDCDWLVTTSIRTTEPH